MYTRFNHIIATFHALLIVNPNMRRNNEKKNVNLNSNYFFPTAHTLKIQKLKQ